MKEKERIDNDITIDKKRKQNLKKKLRKKLKKAAIKMNNESIIETEDNDNEKEICINSLNTDIKLDNELE